MKKSLTRFLALAMIIGVLTGCGGKEGGENPTPSSGTGNPAPVEELKWPQRDITLTVGYAAGGDCDVATRYLAGELGKELGVNVVVTNMKGSNAALACEEVFNTNDPEYNFLVVNTASLSANVATGVYDKSYKDFETVSLFSSYSGETLYVPAGAPYDTFEEFVAYAKENPVVMGVTMGGSLYAAGCAMNAQGLKLEFIDAGDGVDRLISMLGGNLDCTFASYSSARDYIENGDFKELATLCSSPIAAAPGLPCVCDTLPGVIINTKFVMLAKPGVDQAICQKINDAMQRIYETNPDYVQKVEEYTFQSAKPMTIEESLAELEVQYQTFQEYKQYLN